MKITLLTLLVVLTAMSTLAQGQAVHVSTTVDPSGLVDAGTTARLQAVDAIRKRLRKRVRLVDAPGAGTIQIVVTSVASEAVWRPTMYAAAEPITPGDPLPEGTRPALVARATLTRDTFSTSFAEAAGAFRGSATENLARSIDEWFKANADTLRR